VYFINQSGNCFSIAKSILCDTFRLPFAEAQLELDDADMEENDYQPQGFINNNPR
jgi:hypothetical protein